MHPGAEEVYSSNVYEPSTDEDLHAYVECGMYDLVEFLNKEAQ